MFDEKLKKVVQYFDSLNCYVPTMEELKESHPREYKKIKQLEVRIQKRDIEALKEYYYTWLEILKLST